MSEAMVVKIAKKLGFSGFRDFRTGVYRATAACRPPRCIRSCRPTTVRREIVQKVFRTSIHALEETLAILDSRPSTVPPTYSTRRRQRDFYGIGGSAQIARDVAHKFLRIGIRANVLRRLAHDADVGLAARGRRRRGRLLAFRATRPPSSTPSSSRASRARGRSPSPTMADSPLAQIADIVLCSTAQGSPLMGENAAARIAQLNILDALFVAVAQRDYQAAERNLGEHHVRR